MAWGRALQMLGRPNNETSKTSVTIVVLQRSSYHFRKFRLQETQLFLRKSFHEHVADGLNIMKPNCTTTDKLRSRKEREQSGRGLQYSSISQERLQGTHTSFQSGHPVSRTALKRSDCELQVGAVTAALTCPIKE
jgi:hypothetical protein